MPPADRVAAPLRSHSDRQNTPFSMRIVGGQSISISGREFQFASAQQEAITTFNQQFVAILGDVRRQILTNGNDAAAIDFRGKKYGFLARLKTTGLAAYKTLWNQELRDYFKQKAAMYATRGLSITFQFSEKHAFYWEALCDGNAADPAKAADFWGFRHPIGRWYFGLDESDEVALQGGMLSAVHKELKLSQGEVEAIKKYLAVCKGSLAPNFRMLDEVLHPEAPTVKKLITFFQEKDFSFGLIHFACHCDVQENSLNTVIRLTSCGQEIELVVEDLLAEQDQGFPNLPFVFLNACETADVEGLKSGLAFSRTVLNFKAAGVIATACVVPDAFASAFAKEFYRRLLAKCKEQGRGNIAGVLMDTRLHFMEEFENPMGLAYGLHAISSQQFQVEA